MSVEEISLPCLFWRIFPVCQSRRCPCFVRFNGFCYICQSWKFPCFVRFRGFLLYVSRGDFPALSVSMGFAIYVSRGNIPALFVLEDFCYMSVEEISLPCIFWRIFPVCQSRRFPCFVRFNGFCYICQSWKFPCFVRFRGFLL